MNNDLKLKYYELLENLQECQKQTQMKADCIIDDGRIVGEAEKEWYRGHSAAYLVCIMKLKQYMRGFL